MLEWERTECDKSPFSSPANVQHLAVELNRMAEDIVPIYTK